MISEQYPNVIDDPGISELLHTVGSAEPPEGIDDDYDDSSDDAETRVKVHYANDEKGT